ncbi:hypothetical protein K7X08_012809 [Anisodus acutangulus]|uniref:Uncharacterized protein n=1 Tax=Anisodus acutangulus TaxID=402998 RepID=A0A9Q1M9T9_9SOLA|nr:hypothetical protein K7X08_012809 [Anisodus acutangulus]
MKKQRKAKALRTPIIHNAKRKGGQSQDMQIVPETQDEEMLKLLEEGGNVLSDDEIARRPYRTMEFKNEEDSTSQYVELSSEGSQIFGGAPRRKSGRVMRNNKNDTKELPSNIYNV